MNSKAKGKRGELEARDAIAQHLGVTTRRTAQVDGGLSADLTGWPGVHLEIKRHKAIAAERFLIQAENDAQPGAVPVALCRADRGEWFAMVRLSELRSLCGRVAAIDGKPIFPERGNE